MYGSKFATWWSYSKFKIEQQSILLLKPKFRFLYAINFGAAHWESKKSFPAPSLNQLSVTYDTRGTDFRLAGTRTQRHRSLPVTTDDNVRSPIILPQRIRTHPSAFLFHTQFSQLYNILSLQLFHHLPFKSKMQVEKNNMIEKICELWAIDCLLIYFNIDDRIAVIKVQFRILPVIKSPTRTISASYDFCRFIVWLHTYYIALVSYLLRTIHKYTCM